MAGGQQEPPQQQAFTPFMAYAPFGFYFNPQTGQPYPADNKTGYPPAMMHPGFVPFQQQGAYIQPGGTPQHFIHQQQQQQQQPEQQQMSNMVGGTPNSSTTPIAAAHHKSDNWCGEQKSLANRL